MSASVLRRVVVLVSMVAVAVVLVNRSKQRSHSVADTGEAEWPAWPEPAEAPANAPDAATAGWVAGSAGDAPDGYPIKLNGTSGIFHVPGGRFYERTTADRWYATAEAAIADGYRQSKT